MDFNAGDILRGVLIISGLFMFAKTIGSLAKRKMHESFCLAWGVVSIAFFLAGLLLRPSQLQTYISKTGLVLIFVIVYGALYAGYFVSLKISELIRKNQELAIQVSLLINENEIINRHINKSEQEDGSE